MADFGTLNPALDIESGPLLDSYGMVSIPMQYGALDEPSAIESGEAPGTLPVIGQLYPS